MSEAAVARRSWMRSCSSPAVLTAGTHTLCRNGEERNGPPWGAVKTNPSSGICPSRGARWSARKAGMVTRRRSWVLGVPHDKPDPSSGGCFGDLDPATQQMDTGPSESDQFAPSHPHPCQGFDDEPRSVLGVFGGGGENRDLFGGEEPLLAPPHGRSLHSGCGRAGDDPVDDGQLEECCQHLFGLFVVDTSNAWPYNGRTRGGYDERNKASSE